jgi:hypothetical protein
MFLMRSPLQEPGLAECFERRNLTTLASWRKHAERRWQSYHMMIALSTTKTFLSAMATSLCTLPTRDCADFEPTGT